MQTCTQCGATSPVDSTWCTSCYLLFAPPTAASGEGTIAPALPPAGPDVVIPPQSPGTQPAVVLPPPAPAAAVAQPPPAPVALVPTQPTAADPPSSPYVTPLPQAGWTPPAEWATPAAESAFSGLPAVPVHPGWAPPAGWSPPSAVGAPNSDPVAEGRLLSGRALVIVAVSIGIGAVYQGVVKYLERDQNVSIPTLVRWNIVLNIAVYAVVGTLVVTQITPKVRLRWGEGSPLGRVAFGAGLGLLGGGFPVALLSAAHHGLSTDPRAVQLMSEGDILHIVVTVGLVCVAAPLVEETLFRGLLLESLRHHNLRVAVFVSAACFAIWHLNKDALIYYTLMGCVFGGIYVRRGLLSSMCAHAGFNGVLTAVAIVIVLGPSHTYDVGGLQVTVPSSWTQPDSGQGASSDPFAPQREELVLEGPDASGFAMFDLGPLQEPFNPSDIEAHLQNLTSIPLPPGSSFDAGTIREATLPTVGTAVEANLSVHSSSGELAFFAYDNNAYVTSAVTGGNPKADSAFTNRLPLLIRLS